MVTDGPLVDAELEGTAFTGSVSKGVEDWK
jgi:hypothetical protein